MTRSRRVGVARIRSFGKATKLASFLVANLRSTIQTHPFVLEALFKSTHLNTRWHRCTESCPFEMQIDRIVQLKHPISQVKRPLHHLIRDAKPVCMRATHLRQQKGASVHIEMDLHQLRRHLGKSYLQHVMRRIGHLPSAFRPRT